MATEHEIKARWEQIPVAENVVGQLHKDFDGNYVAFFEAFDRWIYEQQSHILDALNKFDWSNKHTLEIGLGQGADSEQLIRRGAKWSGIDLTEESVKRVKKRMELRQLDYEEIVQGSALNMPFPDKHFDIVYSHGVLHHIPDILRAQSEIRRVLKDNGRLIMMVYARNSVNYQLAIRILRRVGLGLIYFLPFKLPGIYEEHRQLARAQGFWNYVKLSNFIHRATDGPHNPYSKVYTRREIEKDFPDFEIVQTFKLWMHAPPLPIDTWTSGSWLGWHLWAVLRPKT